MHVVSISSLSSAMGTRTLLAAEVVNGDDARFANFLILFISVLVNEFLTRGDIGMIYLVQCILLVMSFETTLGTQAICDLLINGKRFVTYRFITTLRVVVKADDDANLPINRTSGIRAFIDEGCCSIKVKKML